jgi:signal transduction histidine kinase
MNATHPLNLKISVMLRVALCALACAVGAAFFVIAETRLDVERRLRAKAELAAGKLGIQAIRFQTELERDERLPDWRFLADRLLEEGSCIRFEKADGAQVYASCVGVSTSANAAPTWFSSLYRISFSPIEPVRQVIEIRGKSIATLEVSLDPTLGEARAWSETRRIMSVTASAIALLTLTVYLAIDRALRPTRTILAGVERLGAGDLSYRLPKVPLIELQRIGEVINRMAAGLESSMEEREDLVRRLAVAQEDERRHLARELHDEFGQNLAAINAIAASLGSTARTACPELAPEAASLSRIAAKMMDELRNTVARLRPSVVDELGLVESLRDMVDAWNIRLGSTTRFTFQQKGYLGDVPDPVAIAIFRIAQEGLTNAARHASARNVFVTIERIWEDCAGKAKSAARLTIEDDGKGFDPQNATRGAGLAGIRERIVIFKGRIELCTRVSGGARLAVTIPTAFDLQEAA